MEWFTLSLSLSPSLALFSFSSRVTPLIFDDSFFFFFMSLALHVRRVGLYDRRRQQRQLLVVRGATWCTAAASPSLPFGLLWWGHQRQFPSA